jgi:immunoglobulin-binding protein 1
VTHINPQFEMRRETIRSQVFQPGHRLPTMSLEELADREYADAVERQQREADAPVGPRRYEQLHEDGDEDDHKLVNEATEKDRAWDDYKDANPRGIGNKKGSQF